MCNRHISGVMCNRHITTIVNIVFQETVGLNSGSSGGSNSSEYTEDDEVYTVVFFFVVEYLYLILFISFTFYFKNFNKIATSEFHGFKI